MRMIRITRTVMSRVVVFQCVASRINQFNNTIAGARLQREPILYFITSSPQSLRLGTLRHLCFTLCQLPLVNCQLSLWPTPTFSLHPISSPPPSDLVLA